jgi:hypothetical protein
LQETCENHADSMVEQFCILGGHRRRHRSVVTARTMNDTQLRDFRILAISKPHAWTTDSVVVAAPREHSKSADDIDGTLIREVIIP